MYGIIGAIGVVVAVVLAAAFCLYLYALAEGFKH